MASNTSSDDDDDNEAPNSQSIFATSTTSTLFDLGQRTTQSAPAPHRRLSSRPRFNLAAFAADEEPAVASPLRAPQLVVPDPRPRPRDFSVPPSALDSEIPLRISCNPLPISAYERAVKDEFPKQWTAESESAKFRGKRVSGMSSTSKQTEGREAEDLRRRGMNAQAPVAAIGSIGGRETERTRGGSRRSGGVGREGWKVGDGASGEGGEEGETRSAGGSAGVEPEGSEPEVTRRLVATTERMNPPTSASSTAQKAAPMSTQLSASTLTPKTVQRTGPTIAQMYAQMTAPTAPMYGPARTTHSPTSPMYPPTTKQTATSSVHKSNTTRMLDPGMNGSSVDKSQPKLARSLFTSQRPSTSTTDRPKEPANTTLDFPYASSRMNGSRPALPDTLTPLPKTDVQPRPVAALKSNPADNARKDNVPEPAPTLRGAGNVEVPKGDSQASSATSQKGKTAPTVRDATAPRPNAVLNSAGRTGAPKPDSSMRPPTLPKSRAAVTDAGTAANKPKAVLNAAGRAGVPKNDGLMRPPMVPKSKPAPAAREATTLKQDTAPNAPARVERSAALPPRGMFSTAACRPPVTPADRPAAARAGQPTTTSPANPLRPAARGAPSTAPRSAVPPSRSSRPGQTSSQQPNLPSQQPAQPSRLTQSCPQTSLTALNTLTLHLATTESHARELEEHYAAAHTTAESNLIFMLSDQDKALALAYLKGDKELPPGVEEIGKVKKARELLGFYAEKWKLAREYLDLCVEASVVWSQAVEERRREVIGGIGRGGQGSGL